MNTLSVKKLHSIHRATNNFLNIMKLKLFENLDKNSWENCSYIYLRSRINDELKELDDKILAGDILNAREECADIANFCMMISDNISYGRFKLED